MRPIRVAIVCGVVLFLALSAQHPAYSRSYDQFYSQSPQSPQLQQPSTEHPAQKLLDWGAKRLPYPTWTVTIEEKTGGVIAYWTSTDSLVSYTKNFSFAMTDPTMVAGWITNNWLSDLLVNYSPWKTLNRCTIGQYTLLNIDTAIKGFTYKTRYWVWSDAEGYSAIHLVFGGEHKTNLDSFAQEIFGAAANCHNILF